MHLDSSTKKNLVTEQVVIGEGFYKIFLWGNCEVQVVQEGVSPTQHHLCLEIFFEILFYFNFFHVFQEKYFCKSEIFCLYNIVFKFLQNRFIYVILFPHLPRRRLFWSRGTLEQMGFCIS